MYSTTKSRWVHILVWLLWLFALLALAWASGLREGRLAWGREAKADPALLVGSVTYDLRQGPLFPWQPCQRWRKWAVVRYRAARRASRRALWAARLAYWRAVWAVSVARLLLTGAMTMATVVDLLTRAQLRRHLGALPVLYGLLEILQVRQIINRHCPTAAEVEHGTVAVVLVLNRLTVPRGLYRVADWVAQTVLVHTLGIPAEKFNDDRLGRTLDAMAQYRREIWLDIVHQALVRFDIDLRFLFYDLTAFVMQGEFEESRLVDYGFAHNTPSDKQKVKLGVTATGDGFVPTEYAVLSGRTADLKTVQENMERLCRLLQEHGYPLEEVVVIGDRATLNDELAVKYDEKGLRYLAGLQPQKKAHRQLLTALSERELRAHPLTDQGGAQGYFGLQCAVSFEHEGRRVTHQGLVVLSGPMAHALRRTRAQQMQTLGQALEAVKAKIGQKRYRSVQEVQTRAETCLRRSPVGRLMQAEAYQAGEGTVSLRWWIDRAALQQALRTDGRYLLVTNDFRLSPRQMLALYRAKDGLEKRFTVAKQVLRVRPIYLHKDERIEAMLLINMIALLVYSLLEREMQRQGLPLTMHRVIEQLEGLAVIETHCWDGSVLYRLTPLSQEQGRMLTILGEIVAELRLPRLRLASEQVTVPCLIQETLPAPLC